MSRKNVYFFGGGTAEGRGGDNELLGGKGAGLAEMSSLGISVPPGFTLTTEACVHYHANGGELPSGLREEVDQHLQRLEKLQGRKFGDVRDPLLLSVRSGGPVSMPGMMDTVLKLGLNDKIVAAQVEAGTDPRFIRDCYRRLLTMYGNVVLGAPHRKFEEILAQVRADEGVETDAEISSDGLGRVIESYRSLLDDLNLPFPQDPRDQLWGGILAVFDSWNVQRARDYRRLHGLTEDSGTGVNVQTMVFGNRGEDCATGVAFTRDPATGSREIYGEYLVNAQGEDVVAGIRTPLQIAGSNGMGGLQASFSAAYQSLEEICEALEQHRKDMQDVEFTIEHGKLYMLQTRAGKRTGRSAIVVAVDMVEEGLIDRREALRRVQPRHLIQILAPEFDLREKEAAIQTGDLLAKGLAAGPGAASGRIALTAAAAEKMAVEGPVLLVRDETSPEERGELRVGERVFREGDEISIDGTSGEVIAGALAARPSEILRAVLEDDVADATTVDAFLKILEWADEERRMRVRANADSPVDARVARRLGGQGIGLCRTEHMFFEEDRIAWVRQLILTDADDKKREALAHLLPVQQRDFEEILEVMHGLPVTIRLLDPPLHEFLPREQGALDQLAAQMEIPADEVRQKAEALAEFNPMLGHRGCRLGLTSPEIYEMQVEAVSRATCKLLKAGRQPLPEIMVPLVGSEEEMSRLRQLVVTTIARVLAEEEVEAEIPVGTMIEVPRAALVAEQIAGHADFFSFGTNDLTQMAYGFSRDDVGRFLPDYLESGILPADPFERLDAEGVGQLVRMACEKGRQVKPDMKLGICGEHGGEPHSISFFDSCGLDYISCSPYRVPIARLAAARATLGVSDD
jgi:pyruvate,orthophosphate dikinase